MDGVLERIDEDEEQKTDNSVTDPEEVEEGLTPEKEEMPMEDGLKTTNGYKAAPGHINEGSVKGYQNQANGNVLM